MKLLRVTLGALLLTWGSVAYAGEYSFGFGVPIGQVETSGTETEGTTGTETENSIMTATAGNEFMFGSVYAEYAFGDSERLVLGIDYVPGSADINSKTLSRTDASQGAYTAQDTGTVKANAEISDHTTYYAELGLGAGVYVKAGYSEVDIDVVQNNASGYGTYPDKQLDAWTYGLGYKGGFGDNGVFKIEGFMTDYDSYSATSTTSNTLTADLDVVGAKLALGFKF